MTSSFFFFFVLYFLVVFVALLGFFWNDNRFFWLAAINFVSLMLFFVLSYFLKKKENSQDIDVEKRDDKVRYSSQFVKYSYNKSEKKWKVLFGYFSFFSVFLFLFSVLDLTIFHFLGQLSWLFPLLYVFLLFFVGKDLIDNKIKVFGMCFNFNLFLFISSLIVGVLVYGTLIFDFLPVLLLAVSLVSFLFFFAGYIFIKNQGIRFFFRLVYSKLFFIAIATTLVWTFWMLPAKTQVASYTSNFSYRVSGFFKSLFIKEKSNDDPLLLTGEGVVIGSGIESMSQNVEIEDEQDIFEESGYVVTTGINSVFVSEEENLAELSGALDNIDPVKALKEELSIKNSDFISMIDALRFLIEKNEITLSEGTNTKFTYVSKTNPFYSYWKTAYDKKMIGSSTNPSTKITCETYQVFKGMLLDWDLSYSSATVKKVFWAEAEKKDVLNGCEYGKLLKGENL